VAPALAAPSAGIVALDASHLPAIEALDATVFPAQRPAFLHAWLTAPGHVALGLLRDGGLVGFGVIRPCRAGHKIGPLVAEDARDAEALLAALLARVPPGEVFLDAPEPHRASVALAERLGLGPSSRRRGCTPARLRRCGRTASSASRPSNSAETPRAGGMAAPGRERDRVPG
jgi:hypothetical protein